MRALQSEERRRVRADRLTVADQPVEDEAGVKEWVQGRSAAMQDLMLALRPNLPAAMSKDQKKALAGVLNLAAVVSQQSNSAGLQFNISPWPEVPW